MHFILMNFFWRMWRNEISFLHTKTNLLDGLDEEEGLMVAFKKDETDYLEHLYTRF
jgi:hypothetical protein